MEENAPEIPVERVNEILRGAETSQIECKKLQRVAKENEDDAMEAMYNNPTELSERHRWCA
ncbi:hypothetical protein V1527DRAFT_493515 [Lipomyces starkeyi]